MRLLRHSLRTHMPLGDADLMVNALARHSLRPQAYAVAGVEDMREHGCH